MIMIAVTIPVMVMSMLNYHNLFGVSSAPIAVMIPIPISLDDDRSVLRIRRYYRLGECNCHNSGHSNCNITHAVSFHKMKKCYQQKRAARDNVPKT